MMRRRPSLAFIAAACFGWPCGVRARVPDLLKLYAPEPVVQVAAGGPSGALAIGAQGTLFALDLSGGRVKHLAKGIDPETPLAVGYGRIAARRNDGALWVLDANGSGASNAQALAPGAGLLVLPQAVVGVEAEGARHRIVRLEPSGPGNWARVARSTVDVLPDARPLLADLDGNGDGGHVVVLAGPDTERYRHGVLGDAVEATRLCVLERHSLGVLREIVLAAPHVFEDTAPRRVVLVSRDGLLTVRSGPQGAQLVLVEADPAGAALMRIAASGPALGSINRWMAPTTNGQRWMAVHTPHIGGVLHEYQQHGRELLPTRMLEGVSNHIIGSRRLDLAAWLGPWLLMPDQRQRNLFLLDGRNGWRQAHVWQLPSRVVATASLEDSLGVLILHEDGSVAVARPLHPRR